MYIKKIEFTNFRGFQELSIDLPENLAVFIGWNGSGKTTILDGVYKFLLGFLMDLFNYEDRKADKILGNYFETKNQGYLSNLSRYEDSEYRNYIFNFVCSIINKKDRYYKSDESIIKINYFCDLLKLPITDLSWQYKQSTSGILSSSLGSFYKTWGEIFDINTKSSIPIITYYQYGSLKNKKFSYKEFSCKEFPRWKDYENFGHLKQMLVYKNSFITDFDDYNHFIEWFKEEEDKENEEIRIRKDFNYRNKKLEIIRNGLEQFLTYLNSPNDSKFSDLRIIRNTSDEFTSESRGMKPELTISKDDIELKLSQLSEGEKKCILIVADIARRLAIANPGLEVSEVLKQGKGIILIDEIEAHLHPGWQREIIPALTQTFPSCQFIVTTHSPQVLSKVKKENIFVLEDGKVYEASYTYGRDSNSILSETMGVAKRPIEIQDELDECFDLIDDNQIEQAKAKLKELSDLLGQNDSEIVKVNTTIDFLERIE